MYIKVMHLNMVHNNSKNGTCQRKGTFDQKVTTPGGTTIAESICSAHHHLPKAKPHKESH